MSGMMTARAASMMWQYIAGIPVLKPVDEGPVEAGDQRKWIGDDEDDPAV